MPDMHGLKQRNPVSHRRVVRDPGEYRIRRTMEPDHTFGLERCGGEAAGIESVGL
jgi:hypothetical protein